MKKTMLMIMALASVNAIAGETFIGVGHDILRKGQKDFVSPKEELKISPKIRVEHLPFEHNGIKVGFGVAHNFEAKSKNKETGVVTNLGKLSPVYMVFKAEQELNDDWKVYEKLRLGYSINFAKDHKKDGEYLIQSTYKNGPYAGAELGTEYKNVALGLTYDANFIPDNAGGKQYKGNVDHQFGATVGYLFHNGEKRTRRIASVPTPVVVVKPAPILETPVVKPVEKEVEKRMVKKEQSGKSTILFEFDNPTVTKAQEQKILDATNEVLNQFEYVDVSVTGHTDSKGSDKYNDVLGQKRANFVASSIKENTDENKVNIVKVESLGEKKPVADNSTEEGRAANRRVEVDFKGWFNQIEEIR